MFQHPPEPCSRPAATGWEPAKEKPLPKRNYGFEKRQREIAKKKKQEEKRLKKTGANEPPTQENPAPPPEGNDKAPTET